MICFFHRYFFIISDNNKIIIIYNYLNNLESTFPSLMEQSKHFISSTKFFVQKINYILN